MITTGRRLLTAVATASVAGVFVAAAAAANANAPVNVSAPSISGTAAAGQTLTASPGTWQGSGIDYSYAWEVCDQSGGNCAVIVHATSRTLTLAASEQGHTVRVFVTATNASGSSTAASKPTDPVSIPLVGNLTLNATKLLVPFGKQLTLSGTVPGAAHENVWIEADSYPFTRDHYHLIGTVQTDANGAFSIQVEPTVNTVYYAQQDGTRSPAVAIDVAPRLFVTPLGQQQWLVKALAGQSLAGTVLLLQRWSAAQQTWISVKHVTLHGLFFEGGGATAATASIHLSRFGRNTRISLAPVEGYARAAPTVLR